MSRDLRYFRAAAAEANNAAHAPAVITSHATLAEAAAAAGLPSPVRKSSRTAAPTAGAAAAADGTTARRASSRAAPAAEQQPRKHCGLKGQLKQHRQQQKQANEELLAQHTGPSDPHWEIPPFKSHLDLDSQALKAKLALQVREQIGEHDAEAGMDEPAISKLVSLAALQGMEVTFGSAVGYSDPIEPWPGVVGVIEDGKIRCKGLGCSFAGTCSQFVGHLGQTCCSADDAAQKLWLTACNISLKDLAQLVCRVDLNIPNCVYCWSYEGG